jgi:hypothetical protein
MPRDPLAAIRLLISQYGVHYSAARLYLINVKNVHAPYLPPPDLGKTGIEKRWESAEQADGISNFPLSQVPAERCTLVAFLASIAYSSGHIQRDEFAEYLGLTPVSDLESVLDFFDLDPPSAAVDAA